MTVAIEFGLNEIGTTRLDLEHYKKDFIRLTDPKSSVEQGYLLFFVRREDYADNSRMHAIIDELPTRLSQMFEKEQDHSGNLVVVYAECKKPGNEFHRIIPESRSHWVR
jgi:hypothetical protein